MKKIFTACIAIIFASIAVAQVPNVFNYQAVARNAQGQAIANQNIKVRLTLTENSAGGSLTFYSETRSVTTNALGLFNVQIGSPGAQNVIGGINNTNWTDNTKTRSLNVEIDIANNGSFVAMGGQQLVSVPYAFAAESARRVSAPFIGFRADRVGQIANIPGTPGYTFTFESERFDSSNVYNPATGEFTAPEDGMYELFFNVNVYLTGSPITDRLGLAFHRQIAGGGFDYMHGGGNVNTIQTLKKGDNIFQGTMLTFLKAGDKVSVRISDINTKSVSWDYSPYGSSFHAYKIR